MSSLSSKIDSHDASIKSVIATSNDTLKNAINAKGCVKSIQRGTTFIDKLPFKSSISINISPIDPNKSLLLLDIYGGGDSILQVTGFNLLQSSIVVGSEEDVRFEFVFSYQVVEFC